MKRRVIAIVLVLALMMTTTVFASDASESRSTTLPEQAIKNYDLLFAGKGEVYDSFGNVITQQFIVENISLYSSGNYDAIRQSCYNMNVSRIHVHESNIVQPSSRAFLEIEYEDTITHYITQPEPPFEGKEWEINVTAHGTYIYQDSYQYIYNFPEPWISYSFWGEGALFSAYVTENRITTPRLNSDKSAASFTVETYHCVDGPVPGLDTVTYTLGPFYTESDFVIEGL